MNTNAAHLPENNTDIDRALSTLRNVDPRAGLNSRILTELDHRATQPAMNPGGPSFHGLFVKGWGIARGSAREKASTARLALWPALAACLIAVASFAILHRHTAPADLAHSLTPQSSASPLDSPQQLVERTSSNHRHPERNGVPGELARWGARTPVFASCLDYHTGCPIHDDSVAMGGVITTSPDPDAQALIDLHTPSHPAPPLPLTPQEKLFLRMYRAGNETLLAELNPLVRAQQAAAETADFKTFFPDPPPLDQSNGDTE